MSGAELARVTGTHERSLHRMLRALAAFGIFSENGRGQYQMTKRAASLRSDVVGSLRDWTVLTGTKPTWDAFGHAMDVVRTGNCGFGLAHGDQANLYHFCHQDPAFSETFVRAQSNWTDWQRDAILDAYDFSRYRKLVDVGGGRGSMISGILRRCPATKGILYDQPATIELARPAVAAAGVQDRCELVPGSFLDKVPDGGDAYVIKHVLRDWDDDTAGTILRNCNRAMRPDSVLLVIDAVLDPRNSRDRIVKLLDLEQMFWLSGMLRTMDEWHRLLEDAGFRIRACHRTRIVDAVVIEAGKTGD